MSTEMAAEALAGLTPATRISIGRSTGTEGLRGCELAGAMRGLNEAQTRLLFAKYIDGSFEGTQTTGFYSLFMDVAVDLATKRNWDLSGNEGLLRRLTVVALGEVTHPQACHTCKGTGYVHSKPCVPCRASGRRPLSGRAKAELCGLAKSTWADTWARRYEQIYARINDIEQAALRKVWSQIRVR